MRQPGAYMKLSSPESLRAWLKHRGMTYQQLGELAGCSKQFIGQLASGAKTTCKPELAEKIELVLLPPREQRTPGTLPLFVERTAKTKASRRVPVVSERVGELTGTVGG